MLFLSFLVDLDAADNNSRQNVDPSAHLEISLCLDDVYSAVSFSLSEASLLQACFKFNNCTMVKLLYKKREVLFVASRCCCQFEDPEKRNPSSSGSSLRLELTNYESYPRR